MNRKYDNFHQAISSEKSSVYSLEIVRVLLSINLQFLISANDWHLLDLSNKIQYYVFIVCLLPEFETCDRDWDKRGCYIGGSNFLPIMLKNYRNLIKWRSFEESIHR